VVQGQSPPRPRGGHPRVRATALHDSHVLADCWLVTLRVVREGDERALVFERGLSYADGTRAIGALREGGISHPDAFRAFWWGLAQTAAAELAMELAPDRRRPPAFFALLEDPGGGRVLEAALDHGPGTTPLTRNTVVREFIARPG
jgi:hypothetical protein